MCDDYTRVGSTQHNTTHTVFTALLARGDTAATIASLIVCLVGCAELTQRRACVVRQRRLRQGTQSMAP